MDGQFNKKILTRRTVSTSYLQTNVSKSTQINTKRPSLNKSSSCSEFVLIPLKHEVRIPITKIAWSEGPETHVSKNIVEGEKRIRNDRFKANTVVHNQHTTKSLFHEQMIRKPVNYKGSKIKMLTTRSEITDHSCKLFQENLIIRNNDNDESQTLKFEKIEKRNLDQCCSVGGDKEGNESKVNNNEEKLSLERIERQSIDSNDFGVPILIKSIHKNENIGSINDQNKKEYNIQANVNKYIENNTCISDVKTIGTAGEPRLEKVSSITIKLPNDDKETKKRCVREVHVKSRYSGYREPKTKNIINFKDMFLKPKEKTNPQSSNQITFSVESISLRDKRILSNTRSILKQEVDKKRKASLKVDKIPLKINLRSNTFPQIIDTDDKIIKSLNLTNSECKEVHKLENSTNTALSDSHPINDSYCFPLTFKRSSSVTGSSGPRMSSGSKMSSGSRMSSGSKIKEDISTQVSRSSPVPSDINILPHDILDKDEVHELKEESCLFSKVRRGEEPKMLMDNSLAEDLTDILSIASDVENSLSTILEVTERGTPRSDSQSNRLSTRNKVDENIYAEQISSKKKVHLKDLYDKIQFKNSPSNKTTQKNGKCFAKVQEALALQSKLLESNIKISNATLLSFGSSHNSPQQNDIDAILRQLPANTKSKDQSSPNTFTLDFSVQSEEDESAKIKSVIQFRNLVDKLVHCSDKCGSIPERETLHLPQDISIDPVFLRIVERTRKAKEGCTSNDSRELKAKISQDEGLDIIRDNIHHLSVCINAKAASTSLIMYAKVLTIYNVITKMIEDLITKSIRKESNLDNDLYTLQGEERDFPDSNMKVVVVRHPFQRLVSAYNNKVFLRDHSEGLQNTDKFQSMLSLSLVPDSETIDLLGKPKDKLKCSRYLKGTIGDLKPTINAHGQVIPSFRGFALSVISFHRNCDGKRSCLRDGNVHMMSQVLKCGPCQMNYDAILKMETLHEDLPLVERVLGIESAGRLQQQIIQNREQEYQDATAPEGNLATNSHAKMYLYGDYMNELAPHEMDMLFEIYENDFNVYGYDPCKDINNTS